MIIFVLNAPAFNRLKVVIYALDIHFIMAYVTNAHNPIVQKCVMFVKLIYLSIIAVIPVKM